MARAIAVVEDDESIREMLRYYFQSVGYAVRAYESGEALFAGEEGQSLPALYILDIMLPGMDGLEILRRLREGRDTADVPVIMLTARTAEMDRVAGLENGADDYVVKPFGIMELQARVKAVLRRTERRSDRLLTWGDLEIDPAAREVRKAGRVVELTYNCPYFLDICAFPNTMPLREDIVEGNTTWTDPSTYVTNGPFKMESWTHDAEIVMVPNENYYDAGSISIESLTFALMDDANAQLTAFNSGDLDFMQNPPPDEVATLLADGTLIAGDYLGTYYACFNNSKAPFDDVNVRKAFNLAIDRNYIVEMVTQAGEIPAGAWVPESVVDAEGTDGPDFREVGGDFWSTAAEDYEANCEQARELLAQAGYPNGEGFPETTYLYNTDDKHQAVAEALQQMWSNVLGVNVTLNNQDWNVFLETRSAGDYSICRNGWIADYNDPVSFLDMFMTDNGNNDAHYSNPEYDAMMTTVLSDSDAAGRMELMHQAETLLCDTDCAIAPLYYYSQPYMVSDRVHGMYYTPLGNFIFTYATVE